MRVELHQFISLGWIEVHREGRMGTMHVLWFGIARDLCLGLISAVDTPKVIGEDGATYLRP